MAKILVTGATGFLGSNLVRKLCRGKDDVTIFVPKGTSHPLLKGLKIKRINGDVRDYASVLIAIKGHKYVYHFVGLTLVRPEEKKELFSVNIKGTENVMKACLKSGVKKVVHVSTAAVVGFSKNERIKLTENDNFDCKDNLYAQSKILGDIKVREYIKKGLIVTFVNPCSVYGQGMPSLPILRSIENGRIKFAFPGGTTVADVDDIIDGMILAMKKGKKGQRYLLGYEYFNIKHTYDKIAVALNKPKIKFVLPKITYYPMYLLATIIEKLLKNPPVTAEMIRWAYNYRRFDTTRAREDLGWSPSITFDESIRKTIDYFKKYNIKY